jgi:hypothetical protein
MASELARVFPEHVLRDELNNRHVLLSISELKELGETLARKTENGGVSDDGFMPDNDAMSYSFLKAAFVLLVTDDDLNEVVE